MILNKRLSINNRKRGFVYCVPHSLVKLISTPYSLGKLIDWKLVNRCFWMQHLGNFSLLAREIS